MRPRLRANQAAQADITLSLSTSFGFAVHNACVASERRKSKHEIDQIKELAKNLSEYGFPPWKSPRNQTTVKLARQSFTPEGEPSPSFAPLAGQKEPAGLTRPGCVTIFLSRGGGLLLVPSPDAAPFVTAGSRVKKGGSAVYRGGHEAQ
jgi:hypothetical protein